MTALSCLAIAPATASSGKHDGAGDREPLSLGTSRAQSGALAEFRDAVASERGERPARAGVTAVEAGAPTITAPVADQTVQGAVTVTATSSAAFVRFASGEWQVTVPVSAGTAATTLDAFGRSGPQTLTAVACDEVDCLAPSAAAQVAFAVTNAAITVNQPAPGSTVGTSFAVGSDATGGGVQFLLDGIVVAQDAAAPFQATVNTESFAEGGHVLTAVGCDAAMTECGGATSPPVDITVKRSLAPEVSSISPQLFSPNGDGRRDITTVTYSLETAQSVSWRVLDMSGSLLRGPVTIGNRAAGTYAFSYNGGMAGGGTLPTGDYILQLRTTKAVTGETITGVAERTFRVDVTPPSVGSRAASPATFHPVNDGYRDTTVLSGYLNEDVSAVRVEVLNGSGSKVRTLALGSRTAGKVSATWNGRTAGGTLLAAGTYAFRFVAQDLAGNQVTTGKTSVTLTHKKLVGVTETKEVSAQGSFVEGLVGFCSDLVQSDYYGNGIAYLSDYYCDSAGDGSGDDLAFARHRLVLPTAVKYGAIRVDAYGQRDAPGYPDNGVILYEDAYQGLTDRGAYLGSSEGWHQGETVSGANFVSGRVMRWWAGTLEFNWYDIRSFRVRYTYYVLR